MNTSVKDKLRCSGDGMESTVTSLSGSSFKEYKVKLNYRPSEEILKSLQPIEPKTRIPAPFPKYVPKTRKNPKFIIGKPKEPRFIPYEPYKGAVDPIIPRKKVIKRECIQKPNKNNIDINDLVNQIAEVRIAELSKAKLEAIQSDDPVISRKQWEVEKKAYQTDIKNLQETNAHLENQIKFQAQVNSELKTLLVAAVGEDLETRVQHLTEDKLQLARALLNSANHLTSHQEQTEWLSGQCEVWRSKFLASSLMVEELARWKSALTIRVNELQDIVKLLVEEHKKARTHSLKSYNSLTHISKHLNRLDNLVGPLKSANILELAGRNSLISEDLADYLVKDVSSQWKSLGNYEVLNKSTLAEKHALRALMNPVTISTKPDIICNALVGAAMSLTGKQMYLQHPSIHTTCAHCKGELENI